MPFSIKKLGQVNGGAAKRKHAQKAEIALRMEKIARQIAMERRHAKTFMVGFKRVAAHIFSDSYVRIT